MIDFLAIDKYDTKENQRKFMDKVFLGTNIFFTYRYIKIVVKASLKAKRDKYDTLEWQKSSFDTIKMIEDCGGILHIRNLQNLKKVKGPVVFISNHMSVLETFVFPCLISPFHKMTFIVKDSLINYPVFGSIMKSREPVIVKRVNPREDFQVVMSEGKKKLQNGISIVVFPQSTRESKFIPENFNTIGVKLAKKAGVDVIPIAIKTDFWGNGKLLKDFGKINRNLPIYIEFGEPMKVDGSGKKEHKQIVEFISEKFNKWEKI